MSQQLPAPPLAHLAKRALSLPLILPRVFSEAVKLALTPSDRPATRARPASTSLLTAIWQRVLPVLSAGSPMPRARQTVMQLLLVSLCPPPERPLPEYALLVPSVLRAAPLALSVKVALLPALPAPTAALNARMVWDLPRARPLVTLLIMQWVNGAHAASVVELVCRLAMSLAPTVPTSCQTMSAAQSQSPPLLRHAGPSAPSLLAQLPRCP